MLAIDANTLHYIGGTNQSASAEQETKIREYKLFTNKWTVLPDPFPGKVLYALHGASAQKAYITGGFAANANCLYTLELG